MNRANYSTTKNGQDITSGNLLRKILVGVNLFLKSSPGKYFSSAFIVSVSSLLLFYLHMHVGYQAISLLFLFIISLMPLMNFGPGPIFLAAVMSAFIWNFFFIPPSFTLRIGKVEDVLMFVMYFIIASVSGLLISRIRTQQLLINQREKRTASLYNLARDLSSAKSLDDVTNSAIRQLKETFNAEVAFIYFENQNKLKPVLHSASTYKINDVERSTVQWVFINSQKAGRFTNTLQATSATYFPLLTKTEKLGVIGLKFSEKTIF